MYRQARQTGAPEERWRTWREARDALFGSHPQSALEGDARKHFEGLPYFPYDPAWRLEVNMEPVEPARLRLSHSGEGWTEFRAFGRVRLPLEGGPSLVLYWLEGYAGGVFLPFRDATSGRETYGGGRYLLDTAKGADLGHSGDRLVLDFNYAYHPSCVHSSRWSCPLAPAENRLSLAVEVGERLP